MWLHCCIFFYHIEMLWNCIDSFGDGSLSWSYLNYGIRSWSAIQYSYLISDILLNLGIMKKILSQISTHTIWGIKTLLVYTNPPDMQSCNIQKSRHCGTFVWYVCDDYILILFSIWNLLSFLTTLKNLTS